ncbi:hypothetical protein [Nocardia sienata]|uniref:hypothetical protein n=1 Tax=Nocardia sienata TaxID=248552 RepID=UPI0007A484D6|nr:hypothetical protein [Nocardia sienata]
MLIPKKARRETREDDSALSAAERVVRRQVERASFFAGGIHKKLRQDKKPDTRYIEELDKLIELIPAPRAAGIRS